MKLKLIIASFCLVALSVQAQENKVQLVEQSESNAVFYVTVPYTKIKDMKEDAQLSVFKAIMYNGLENLNNGRPLIQRNTTYTADFLNTDKKKYSVFVKGIYHEGGEKDKKYNNHIIVVVNYNSLLNTLKRTGSIVN